MSERINFSARNILKFLALGGILFAAVAAPNAVRCFSFLRDDEKRVSWEKFSHSKARMFITRLQKRGLVKRRRANNRTEFVLTEKGKTEIKKYEFKELKLKRDKEWDGKWRIIIFDIPEYNKAAREALRRTFYDLGVHQLQKSVFVYPFECKKEIDFVADFFGVGDDILFIEGKIDDIEESLKTMFNLR